MPGGAAAQRFELTAEEADGYARSCVETNRGQASPAVVAWRCGCLTQTLQWSISRKEFDDYGSWLVWRSTWRRRLWRAEEPRGVAANIQRGVALCRSPPG